IRNAEVLLSPDDIFSDPILTVSDNTGSFVFPDNLAGNPYFLKAIKDNDYLEGVSTLDIIQIRKHLLGIQKFHSPYQYLAADVTGNQVVSVLDIVDLRKLILGVNTHFPGNTSWRFGRPGQNLTIADPWTFDETIFIPSLGADLENINFLGVKIGDVNDSFGALGSPIET